MKGASEEEAGANGELLMTFFLKKHGPPPITYVSSEGPFSNHHENISVYIITDWLLSEQKNKRASTRVSISIIGNYRSLGWICADVSNNTPNLLIFRWS